MDLGRAWYSVCNSECHDSQPHELTTSLVRAISCFSSPSSDSNRLQRDQRVHREIDFTRPFHGSAPVKLLGAITQYGQAMRGGLENTVHTVVVHTRPASCSLQGGGLVVMVIDISDPVLSEVDGLRSPWIVQFLFAQEKPCRRIPMMTI